MPDVAATETPKPETRPGALSAEEAAAHRTGAGYSSDLISIPRSVLYAQAVMILFVAAIFFAAGYALGPGPDDRETERVEKKEKFGKPVLAFGKLTYQDGEGNPVADAGSAVIVIPRGSKPADRIAAEGLRPTDPPLTADNTSAEAIRFMEGACLRTDELGEFEITVPSGRYYVLVISKAAPRRDNRSIKPQDIEAMAEFFDDPEKLIGDRRYEWKTRKIDRDSFLNISLD